MPALTAEQRMLRDTAGAFARDHVAPLGRADTTGQATDPPAWRRARAAFAEAGKAGLTAILVPAEHGGPGGSCLDLVVALEELAAADVAFAANYVNLPAAMAALLIRYGTEEQRAAVCAPGGPPLIAGALNEADVAGSDLFCPTPGPQIGIRTTARRLGDGFLLNGHKCGFVTNGGIADAYLVLARTDPQAPPAAGMSMFYVPAGTPGLSTGPRTEMIGWHSAHHAEVRLDNVALPAGALVGAEHQAGRQLGGVPEMAIGLAACFVGLARAAYDEAVSYARQRISWGKPLIEHPTVAVKLADMQVDLRTARLLVHDAARSTVDDPADAMMIGAAAAKTHAVDVAIANAQRSVEIFGGYGVANGSAVARYLSDAWIGYSCDFSRDVLRLSIAAALP